jgi:hypothetical protein
VKCAIPVEVQERRYWLPCWINMPYPRLKMQGADDYQPVTIQSRITNSRSPWGEVNLCLSGIDKGAKLAA